MGLHTPLLLRYGCAGSRQRSSTTAGWQKRQGSDSAPSVGGSPAPGSCSGAGNHLPVAVEETPIGWMAYGVSPATTVGSIQQVHTPKPKGTTMTPGKGNTLLADLLAETE